MINTIRRRIALLLTFVIAVSSCLAGMPGIAHAATLNPVTGKEFHDILYAFSPKSTQKTKSSAFGFTPNDDYFKKVYRKNTNISYALILDSSGDKSSVGAGVRYTNVGVYGGKPVDMTVEVTDYSGFITGKKLETATKGKYVNAKPVVVFRKKTLSISAMCVEDVTFRFTFYESGTDTVVQPAQGQQLKGHVTFHDVDNGQGFTFKEGFGDIYYRDGKVEGKKWFRVSGKNTIEQDQASREGLLNGSDVDDKFAWITGDFEGDHFTLTYHTNIENGSNTIYDTDEDGKINGGEATGNGRALFRYSPDYVDLGLNADEYPEPEKKVGKVGFEKDFDSAEAHADRENAYHIGGTMGTSQFQYTIQQELYSGDFEKFVLSDTLKDCLTPVKKLITVTKDDGSGSNIDVTSQFDINVSGQKVKATAKETAMADDSFDNAMTYRLNIVVKRDRSKPMEADDGDSHYVSNIGSSAIKLAEQDEVKRSTEAVWAVYDGTDAGGDVTKVVGDAGASFDSMDPHDDSRDAYELDGYREYDYAVQASASDAPTSFIFRDTLEACLDIDNAGKVKITDKNGKLVNSGFDIRITEDTRGQKTVEAQAKAATLSDTETFAEGSPYTFRLTVHRKTGQDIKTSMKEWLDEDGYTFRVPNRASIYSVSDGGEKLRETNECWVTDTIDSQLKIEKTCVPYDGWEVGDEVEYAVKISQVLQDGYAVDVEVVDDSLPFDMKLVKNSISVDSSHISGGTIANVEPYGDNGWRATCPRLQYDEYFIVSFRARAGEELNGRDIINTASVSAANDPRGQVSDTAEAWINTPELTVDKIMDKYEHEVGDEVHYTVVVNNVKDYTVARDVVVSDLDIPAGLELKDGADSVQVSVDDTVEWPVADGSEAIGKKTVANKVDLSVKDNSWTVKCRYLSSDMSLVIEFVCIATEAANGQETQNCVKAVADNSPRDADGNAVPAQDDAKVYVNTVDLSIDKIASKYEWHVGDEVEYRIVVSSRTDRPGTIARNVVIKDIEIPEGLEVKDKDRIRIDGVPATVADRVMGSEDTPNQIDEKDYNSTVNRDNRYTLQSEGRKYTVSIPNLPQGSEVMIVIPCTAVKVAEGDEGHEWINRASVEADNQKGHEKKEDEAEIYINTANLTMEKSIVNEQYDPRAEDYDNRESYEFRVGETVRYTLTLRNVQKNSVARNVLVKDITLPEGFQLGDVEVSGFQEKWNDPIPGTEDVSSQLDANHYNETERHDFTYRIDRVKNEETGSSGFTVSIPNLPATVADELNPDWTRPVEISYTCIPEEAVNGHVIVNSAYAEADNAAGKSDSEKVWINSPDLSVDKSSDLEKYRVGDVITYNVVVTQDHYGCLARSVRFEDRLLTEGARLQKSSIVLMDENGRVIDEDDYEIEIYEDHFTLTAGQNLASGENYLLYDLDKQPEAVDGGARSPVEGECRQKFTLEYQVVAAGEQLAGGSVQNKITVDSDEKLPDEDEEDVPVNGPILNVEKISDKELYRVGETGVYKLIVTQIRENRTAENVQVRDRLETEGARILEDSLVIRLNSRELSPEEVTFDEDHAGFVIKTGADITDGDKIEIVYRVLFEEPTLDGQRVGNAAVAGGDNTPEELQEHKVEVKDPAPAIQIEKTSDKQEYKVGETGHYIVRVTQTEKDAVARGVIIKDQVQEEGAQIVRDSIVVKNDNGRVMDDAEIQWSDGRFAIYTGRDLGYRESFTVEYDVVFEKETLAGADVKNTARVTCDNLKTETKDPDPVELGNGLVVKKSSDPRTGSLVKNGSSITFHITVKNTSDGDITNVLVKDPIPEYMTYVESQEQKGVICDMRELAGRGYATFIIERLAAGEEKTVSFLAAVTDAPEDAMILNVAQVRPTRFDIEDIDEDTWMHEDFANTNETVHYLDTRWVKEDYTVHVPGDHEPDKSGEGTPTPTPEPTKAEEETPTPEPTKAGEETPTPEPTKAGEETPTPEPTKEAEETPTPGPSETEEETPTPGPSKMGEGTPTPGPSKTGDTTPAPDPTETEEPDGTPKNSATVAPTTSPGDMSGASETPEPLGKDAGKSAGAVRTGDERPVALVLGAAVLGAAGAFYGITLYRRGGRRNRKKKTGTKGSER